MTNEEQTERFTPATAEQTLSRAEQDELIMRNLTLATAGDAIHTHREVVPRAFGHFIGPELITEPTQKVSDTFKASEHMPNRLLSAFQQSPDSPLIRRFIETSLGGIRIPKEVQTVESLNGYLDGALTEVTKEHLITKRVTWTGLQDRPARAPGGPAQQEQGAGVMVEVYMEGSEQRHASRCMNGHYNVTIPVAVLEDYNTAGRDTDILYGWFNEIARYRHFGPLPESETVLEDDVISTDYDFDVGDLTGAADEWCDTNL